MKCTYFSYPGIGLRTPSDVLEHVCRLSGVSADEIRSSSRKEDVAIVRHVYCYACCSVLNTTMKEIADVINRDRVSVIHSRNVVRNGILSPMGNKKLIDSYKKVEQIFKLKHV